MLDGTHTRRRWWRSRRGRVGCAALAGRRERSGSRPCRDGCRPRCQRDRPSAPPPAARLDPIEPSSTVTISHRTPTLDVSHSSRGWWPLRAKYLADDERADVLSELTARLHNEGFAITDFTDVPKAQQIMRSLGHYRPELDSILQPRRGNKFAAKSFSDLHGHLTFPWHTDGAVALSPPRYIAMLGYQVERDAAPTELFDVATCDEIDMSLRAQLLQIKLPNGNCRRLRCSEVRNNTRLRRWDSRHFNPLASNTELLNLLKVTSPSNSITWNNGRLLLFDNWRFLHRRPAVNLNARRAIWRGYSY